MEDLPDQLSEWNGTLENPTVTLDKPAQSDLADLLPPEPNLLCDDLDLLMPPPYIKKRPAAAQQQHEWAS
jgi:hypothetical protein